MEEPQTFEQLVKVVNETRGETLYLLHNDSQYMQLRELLDTRLAGTNSRFDESLRTKSGSPLFKELRQAINRSPRRVNDEA